MYILLLTPLDTLFWASYAYPGWGLADWWKDRYVQFRCDKPAVGDMSVECNKGNFTAWFDEKDTSYGYPLIRFCRRFFEVLPTHDEAWKIIKVRILGAQSGDC